MSSIQTQPQALSLTLAEKWDAFVKAEADYIGGNEQGGILSATDMRITFRRQAHGIYLSRFRTGIWNQQETLNAWEYYLAHDKALV